MVDQERPGFDTPRLAEAVERLAPEQVDALPFGAIRLDAGGVVTFYSAAERRLSGFGKEGTHPAKAAVRRGSDGLAAVTASDRG